jgi:TolB-like protein/Tfp pilus assembly protein PilF
VQAVIRLYREARRRKVFRTAALYVVGAWLTLQIADVLFPGFGIPNAAIQALVWAAALGLPVALVFGWLFEIGPGGIRRTLPAGAADLNEPPALGRRDYLILAVFAAVAAVLVVQAVQNIRETPVAETLTAETGAGHDSAERLENSIAVLPFTNISNDSDNEYFCDGISEEILNQLAGIRELHVIGRTSSFAFKGSDYGIERISAVLGVRFVLQGSVRKAGDQLRISAQLLDEGGRQVWSESFDRQLRNVFDIQSEIAGAVAGTVAAHVVPPADAGHQPVLAAYDHYLAGRAMLHGRDSLGAAEELQRAVELDPKFAEAHAELAISSLISSELPALDRARESIDRALELKPRLLRAQAAQGLWLQQQTPSDPAGSERVLREVLAQDPNMSDALLWLGNSLHLQGRDDEVRAILDRAALIDPLHPSIVASLAGQLYEAGEIDRAMRLLERQLEQPRPGPMVFGTLRGIYQASGRLVEVNAMAKGEALSVSRQPYFPLVLSYALLGDYASADAWLTRSLREFPDSPGPRIMAIGMQTAQGRYENVGRQMRELFGDLRTPPAGTLQVISGALLARAGEYGAAITFLEPLVDPGSPAETYTDEFWRNGLHALAWAYQHTGADDKAARLLASAARLCDDERAAGRLRDGLELHRCAETQLLRGNTDRALAELERAVAAGWRDHYHRQNDPYWAAVQDRPAYRVLIEKVKVDIDRQRAEVQRIDAREDFAAKVDAARGAAAQPTK